jgi:protein TonB
MFREKKDRNFIHVPRYPGGKKAFIKFINDNLHYPEVALKNNIQGDVLISFDVNDNGEVLSAKIIKGISPECDEEAIRLVKLLRYEKVKNRGIRLKSTIKTTIKFRIKKPQNINLKYEIVQAQKVNKTEIKKSNSNIYSYYINISNKKNN